VPHRVYIGIGSNLGDRRANTIEAVGRVKELPTTKVVRSSSLYESEPLGDAKTWFVNSVIELETELAPEQLLKKLLAIEEAMGRKRVKGKRWGSRIIDLDILLVDDDVIVKRSFKVPHPEMHKRRFVLMPLAELAPHVVHPQLGHSVSTLLATLKDPKRVTLLIPPEPRLVAPGDARARHSLAPASAPPPAAKPARHS
jgi:2-amino-4-hydroxy-6-hydroxymethyldihydropteridine diphosphokinase